MVSLVVTVGRPGVAPGSVIGSEASQSLGQTLPLRCDHTSFVGAQNHPGTIGIECGVWVPELHADGPRVGGWSRNGPRGVGQGAASVCVR